MFKRLFLALSLCLPVVGLTACDAGGGGGMTVPSRMLKPGGAFVAFTNYLHGQLTPKVVAAYIFPGNFEDFEGKSSGFISASLAVRLGVHWRLKLTVTDFFGADPYKSAGLFRDRDEINLGILCQF